MTKDVDVVSVLHRDRLDRCKKSFAAKRSFEFFIPRSYRRYRRYVRVLDELIRTGELPTGLGAFLDVISTADMYGLWWEATRRQEYSCSRSVDDAGIHLYFSPQER